MPPRFPLSVQKKQKYYYSGKKKRHTVKMQAIIHYSTGQILSSCFAKGRVHDFKLFKRSMRSLYFKPLVLADKGYLGLAKTGLISLLAFKASRRRPLDSYLKHLNREINRRRIRVEHVFGALKRFKILSSPYRNRRKRIGLRFNLIAAIFNLELNKI